MCLEYIMVVVLEIGYSFMKVWPMYQRERWEASISVVLLGELL